MQRVYDLIIHRPKSILFFILLLTGFFANHAQHIHLDSSVESLLPKDDPEKAYYDEVRQQFGSDEIGVIGVIADNIYTSSVLHAKNSTSHRSDSSDSRSQKRYQSYQRARHHHKCGARIRPPRSEP